MSESINESYKSLVFFFDEKLLKEFVGLHPELFDVEEATAILENPILLLKSDDNFEKFIQSVFPYFRSRTALKNHFLRLKFQELLLHLLELDSSKQLRAVLYSLYKGEKMDLSFLMNSYYLKPLTLSELARLSGRSLSAFKRDFQDEFNTSPAFWLKNKRLDYADFLLRNSTKNVTEISTEIGYESVSHFIKTYKEKFGVTPKRQG